MLNAASIITGLARRPGDAILVGLSGGLDSTVLLHVLAASPAIRARGLRALHVHHGLHPDAGAWVEHCQRTCTQLDVPLATVRTRVDHDSGHGPEAAARLARHEAFAAELRDDEVLVLAHHRDDQAETFLLRALRASGPDGLGAMRAWRRFRHGWLWRPLLDVPRAELSAYAQHHGLRWIDDPSNADTDLDRNFLRHRVLPLLRERWPHADAAFARSAALSAEAVELLDADDAIAMAAARGPDPNTIDVSTLLLLPVARRARVLRRWTNELGLPPLPSEGVDHIESDLLGAASDAEAAFAWSGAVIRRWRTLLYADWNRLPLPHDWQTTWDGRSPLRLPTGDTLRLEFPVEAASAANSSSNGLAAEGLQAGTAPITAAHTGFDRRLRVHARRGGERITLPGRTHSHALKHVLQDFGIPPWQRDRMPLLSDSGGVVLAAGHVVCSREFDAWLRAHGARLALSD
jgi:tRNA(Ile)-lysidine synthase